jgi:hypothetical protein
MTFTQFQTIKEALASPKSKQFWISCKDGKYEAGNETSFYSKLEPDEYLTYDISNNKVLVNVLYNGTIKYLTIYRSDYYCDTGHFWPGVWVHRDFTKYGPFAFSIQIGKEVFEPGSGKWPYRTSLLGNIFPISEYTGEQVKATVLTYTPISEDGETRPRGVIHGMLVENISNERIRGSVHLPKLFTKDNVPSKTIEAGLPCYRDVGMSLLDRPDKKMEVEMDLAPGQHLWVPVLLYAFGDPTLEEIEAKGSLGWLNSTWAFFKGMTGSLMMPEDDFEAEFFERCIQQCFELIGMDGDDQINGSNWGTYPPTMQTWMKDMYHSLLTMPLVEPSMAKKGILWFTKYCLRPKGAEFEGGASHSLGISLAPAILAGLYYTNSGDKAFFLQHPEIRERIQMILEDLLKTRADDSVWLFSGKFISDGPSIGDFHTGSNVLTWYAFKTSARILDEVYSETELAKDAQRIAEKIKDDLDRNNIIDGPYGKQYIEGKDVDGSIPWMAHDGEESDTTLMPFYGYLDYDDVAYRNFARFAMSEYNAAYSKVTRGISWGETPEALSVKATFPGYITGLANSTERASMMNEHGTMTEIRKLTDVDGSMWWWPYAGENPEYGKPARMNVAGKCGWAAGVFVGLFIDQFLGLKYDAPTKSLRFRPFSPASDFRWEDFKLGAGRFSAGYREYPGSVEAWITNQNPAGIRIRMELILKGKGEVKKVLVNEQESGILYSNGEFLNRKTVIFESELKIGETIRIKVLE